MMRPSQELRDGSQFFGGIMGCNELQEMECRMFKINDQRCLRIDRSGYRQYDTFKYGKLLVHPDMPHNPILQSCNFEDEHDD